MKVLMKKGAAVVSVKVGVAWAFWFALALPIAGLIAFVRRRLYMQALLVIGYIVAQTYLRVGSSMWMGFVDVIPAESSYVSKDSYMVSLLLWCAYGLYLGRYALWVTSPRPSDPSWYREYIYDGKSVTGWPIHAVIRGKCVVRDEALVGHPKGAPVRFLD